MNRNVLYFGIYFAIAWVPSSYSAMQDGTGWGALAWLLQVILISMIVGFLVDNMLAVSNRLSKVEDRAKLIAQFIAEESAKGDK